MKEFVNVKRIDKTPKVSIIMPTFNQFEITKNCINSINRAKLKTEYEIIIADDGSTDETLNIEKYYNNVRLIKTPKNCGFLLNVKNAVQYAKGPYIFLMNNDMIVKPKFLDYLFDTINKDKEIGIVGAMFLNKDDTIQEVGGTLFYDGHAEWNCYRYEKINTLKTYEVDYCSGCGIMFLKEDWDKIGGFDENFAPAYYEDVDLCYQIKYNLGKKIVCQPKAQIYHLCSMSYKKDKVIDLRAQNQSKFLKKWGDKLYKKREILGKDNINTDSFSVYNRDIHKIITLLGIKFKLKSKKLAKEQGIYYNTFLENIFSVKNNNLHKIITILGAKIKLKRKFVPVPVPIQVPVQVPIPLSCNTDSIRNYIKDNNNNLKIKLDFLELMNKKNNKEEKKTILYIDYHILSPDTNAGDRASYLYFKALLDCGFNIIYLPQVRDYDAKTEHLDLMKDYGVEILFDTDNDINFDYLKSWFQKNAKFIDYVFVNRPEPYHQYQSFIDKYLSHAKMIYQGHDIHFLRMSRMAEIEPEKVDGDRIEWCKKTELAIWKKADTILYFSDKEIEIVKSYFPNVKAFSVPLFLYSNVEKISYNPINRKDLLFVGSFNHMPNNDAMRWFIKDIFPLVLKNNPDIKLNVVGTNCPDDIIAMADDNIIFHGYLSDNDLLNLYNQTKIVIAPLRYGAGVKGKIIEAMKNQVPVITTKIGAEGINTDLLTTADNEEEFSRAILDLYNNNEKLMYISEKSYDFIKENFSKEFIYNLIENIDKYSCV